MIQKTLALLFIIPTLSHSQTTIKAHEINIVAYNEGKLNFYKNSNNKFNEVSINEDYYKKDNLEFIKHNIDLEGGFPITKKEIAVKHRILEQKDILNFDFKEHFKKKQFEIIKNKDKQVFNFLNDQIIMVCNYKFEEQYDEKQEKRVKDWLYSSSDFYGYFYLEIKDGKKIILLKNNKGYIIPTKNKFLINIDDNDFTNSKISKVSEDEIKIGLKYFRADNFYQIKKETNGKFSIKDQYDSRLFKIDYDSIFFNNKFIVTKLDNNFEIYNILFENFNIKNIRAVYENGSFLQVLQKNKIRAINFFNNNDINKEEPIIVSGSITMYSLEIDNNIITYKIDQSFSVPKEKIKVLKIDLSSLNLDSVKFLNNTNTFEYDDNSLLFDNNFYSKRNWLIVSKNNKFGLIELLVSDDKITHKELLPIEYDEILSTDYDSPLKLKKDNAYNYYKVNLKKYKNLEKFNKNFCRFELENGNKGWLDIRGNEYFDE
jgi:hypothetical protein